MMANLPYFAVCFSPKKTAVAQHTSCLCMAAADGRMEIKMDELVGYSGFVGSNLKMQHPFGALYNSKNIENAFGTKPDLCVYAGVRAEKFLANNKPAADMASIQNAIENIKKIDAKRFVLISTIDVFLNPYGVDENTAVSIDNLPAYGCNRYYLEQWTLNNIKECHIIRLPGLFGKNIKKNFIYDLIHRIPPMLSEAKFRELSAKNPLILEQYRKQENGFYQCLCQNETERQSLKQAFESLGFSALNFTDSRAVFQFYNLAYLWEHIEFALRENIRLLHVAVEPVAVTEIYHAVKGCDFINEYAKVVPKYDFRTIYAENLGGKNGYIFDKQQVISDIQHFVEDESRS